MAKAGDHPSHPSTWQHRTPGVAALLGGTIRCVNYSHDDTYLVAAIASTGETSSNLLVINAINGKIKFRLKGHNNFVEYAEFSSDDALIVSGSFDNTIRVWTLPVALGSSISEETVIGPSVTIRDSHAGGSVRQVRLTGICQSIDDNIISCGRGDKDIHMWHKSTGKKLRTFTGHSAPATGIDISPNGLLVSGSDDGTVRIWSLTTKEVSPCEIHAADRSISGVVFTPKGNIISCSLDKSIKLWDTNDLVKPITTYLGHEDMVLNVSVSHDGKYAASGSNNKTLHVWELATAVSLHKETKNIISPIYAVSFAHRSNLLSYGSGNRLAQLCQPPQDGVSNTGIPHSGGGGRFYPSKESVKQVGYLGPLAFLEGFVPEQSCGEYMLRDLSKAFGKITDMLTIEKASREIAEDRLEKLLSDAPRLTFEEAHAVVAYTFDTYSKKGDDNLYFQLNEMLRRRNPRKMHLLYGYLHYLMAGLDKLKLNADVKEVFRGIPADTMDIVKANYTEGTSIHWSAFTSTTSNLEEAQDFAGVNGIIFRIKVTEKSGHPLQHYSNYPNEYEILLKPNSKLHVVKGLHKDGDYWFVDLSKEEKQYMF